VAESHLDKSSASKKDKVYWAVLSATIELDLKKGHLKWTLSEVSRKSKVTRSLIYYYFGRSKAGILEEACRIIGDELVGLNDERLRLWQKGQFLQSLMAARDIYDKAPFIPSFIQSHIRSDNIIGENLRAIETRFMKKIENFFPHLSEDEVLAIYAIYWGAVFTPPCSEKALEHVVRALSDQFFKK